MGPQFIKNFFFPVWQMMSSKAYQENSSFITSKNSYMYI
uniref:Uncharacterized protein n=1 Tax=Anguilla anguilla TaxID=7936 RepID=A0A0E9WNJ1_ANGAN